VDPAQWRKEVTDLRSYFGQYGDRVPTALLRELDGVEARLRT
jgi:GTP-dependent phosphoenolpyruvate carboxykinase